MYGYLGNFKGVVKPWYFPFDWVWCRIYDPPTVWDMNTYKLKIVRNRRLPNIHGLPVIVIDGEVKMTTSAWMG